MIGRPQRGRSRQESFTEVRALMLVLVLGLGVLLLPAVLRAIDLNGDNLDDTWEAQYGFTTNAYAATNLVGWWQMEGTIDDRSANKLNGQLKGVTNNAFGPGLFGQTLTLARGGSVTIPIQPALNSTTNGLTFSAWIKLPDGATNAVNLADWTDVEGNSWTMRVSAEGVPQAVFAAPTTKAKTIQAHDDVIVVNDAGWHFVALTVASPHDAVVYVDGEEHGKGNVEWKPGDVASFNFGGGNDDSVSLDEVRLYNRTLGPNEITQLPVTYTDVTGHGMSVYEAWQRHLNPWSSYDSADQGSMAKEPDTAETQPGGPLKWTDWMTHPELDKYLRQLDGKMAGKHPNYFDKGHWVDGLEGRMNGDRMEYRIAYGPVPRHKHYWWFWWFDMPANFLKKRSEEYGAKKFELVSSNSFTDDKGLVHHQGVWHLLEVPEGLITTSASK